MSHPGRSDLFTFIAASFATAGGLFALQIWYGTFIDIRYHAAMNEAAPSAVAVELTKDARQKLASGKLPVEQAMQALASKGRNAFGPVAPTQSSDLSAISGWIHDPSFKPVVAHPIRTARVIAPAEAAVAPAEGAPAEEVR